MTVETAEGFDVKTLIQDDTYVYTKHVTKLIEREKEKTSRDRKLEYNEVIIPASEESEERWIFLDPDVARVITNISAEDLLQLASYVRIGVLKNDKQCGKKDITWITHRFFEYQCDSQEDYLKEGGRPSYSLEGLSLKIINQNKEIYYNGHITIKIHSGETIKSIATDLEAAKTDPLISMMSKATNLLIEMGYHYNGDNLHIIGAIKQPLVLFMQVSNYNVNIDPAGQLTVSGEITGAANKLINRIYIGETLDTAEGGVSLYLKMKKDIQDFSQKEEGKTLSEKANVDTFKTESEALNNMNTFDKEVMDELHEEFKNRMKALPSYIIDEIEYVQLGDVFHRVIGPSLAQTFNFLLPSGAGHHKILWGRFGPECGVYSGKPIYSFMIRKDDLLTAISSYVKDVSEPGIKIGTLINTLIGFTRDPTAYYFNSASEKKQGEKAEAASFSLVTDPIISVRIEVGWDDLVDTLVYKCYIVSERYGSALWLKILDEIRNTKAETKKFLEDHNIPYIQLFHMNTLVKGVNLNVDQDPYVKTMAVANYDSMMKADMKNVDSDPTLDAKKMTYKDQVFLPLKLSLSFFGLPNIRPMQKFYFFTGYDLPQWDNLYDITGITHTVTAAGITTGIETLSQSIRKTG